MVASTIEQVYVPGVLPQAFAQYAGLSKEKARFPRCTLENNITLFPWLVVGPPRPRQLHLYAQAWDPVQPELPALLPAPASEVAEDPETSTLHC